VNCVENPHVLSGRQQPASGNPPIMMLAQFGSGTPVPASGGGAASKLPGSMHVPMLMPQVSFIVQQAGMVIPPNIVGGQTLPPQTTSPASGTPPPEPPVPPDPPVPPVVDPPVPPVVDPPVPPDAPEPVVPPDPPAPPDPASVDPPQPRAATTRAALA